MLLTQILDEAKYYAGVPLEKGGTSIAGGAAPAIKALYGTIIKDGMKVLDYGAGKYARNADFFREHSIETFAYDPFNGNAPEIEGWELGKVAKAITAATKKTKFDVAFSCFVLNVVPKNIEKDIIDQVKKLTKTSIHIVRNKDVFDMVKAAMLKKDKYVYPFYVKEYNGGKEIDPSTLSDDELMEFCEFGVQTSRGFQRIPNLEEYGFTLIRNTSGYKVYQK